MNLIVEKHIRKESTIKIQSIVRRNSAKELVNEKKRFKQIEKQRETSAIKIQSIARRRIANQHVESKRMLQRRRAKILRKLLHALDIKTCNRYTRYAYETLMEWQEMVQIQKENASIKIQSHIRKLNAKKYVHGKRVLKAIVIIQKCVRKAKAKSVVKKRREIRFKKEQNAASIKIQSIVRRNLAIKIVQELLIQRQKEKVEKLQYLASIKIQSIIRKHLATKERERRYHKRIEKLHKCAIQLQCFYRKYQATYRVQTLLLNRHKYLINVVIMQSCVRMYLAKLKLNRKQEQVFHDKLEKAFLIIDNHRKKIVAFHLLKQMEKIRIEGTLSAAAVEIQCFVRKFQALRTKKILQKLEEERIANVIRDNFNQKVVKIQSIVRTFIAMKRLIQLKKQREHHEKAMDSIVEKHMKKISSIKIQSIVRRHSAKQIVQKKRSDVLIEKAIIIQKYYRRFKCVQDFKVEERVMYNNNVSNVLEFAQDIIDTIRETEDVVGNIESNLLGIDMDKLQPNGKKKVAKTWEMLEKTLFQTRLKMMTKRYSSSSTTK
jgi:hypothetical protein